MNPLPIEQANDPDLRFSFAALRRAALRAREVAQCTGTDLIVVESGEVRPLPPSLPLDRLRYRVRDAD